jgi:hypothetical protein
MSQIVIVATALLLLLFGFCVILHWGSAHLRFNTSHFTTDFTQALHSFWISSNNNTNDMMNYDNTNTQQLQQLVAMRDDHWIFNGSVLHSAVILEPRASKLLPAVIRHMLHRLPAQTVFYVFHSDANVRQLMKHFRNLLQNNSSVSSKMKLINVRTHFNITRMTWMKYTPIFLDQRFWNHIEGENVLTFQTDSAICSHSPHKLVDFVGQYDYIGGPYAGQKRSTHQCGGFTIRRRSKMLEAIQKCKHLWKPNTLTIRQLNEDLFFSSVAVNKCKVITLAPVHIARSFCVDSLFYDRPYAIHKVWVRFHAWTRNGKSIKSLRRSCPEISTLLGH